MFRRSLVLIATTLALALPLSLLAQQTDPDKEMRALQQSLSVLNAEMKAQLDQVLLVQEALKANQRIPIEETARAPEPLSVENATALRRNAVQRESALNARLDALLARSTELDAQKQQLLESLRALTARQ